MAMISRGKLAGIDYGTVRIGIAVSDADQNIASPYESYTRRDKIADAKRFERLVEEEQIVGFIIGLPLHASGDESAKSQEARQFGAWIHELTSLPIEFFDERYTSIDAEAELQAAGLTKKRRKARIDMLAAQMILGGYLESGRQSLPSSLDD